MSEQKPKLRLGELLVQLVLNHQTMSHIALTEQVKEQHADGQASQIP